MPTATSFTAFAQGNGLGFVPLKRDVSGYDKWQTLGGFKDTDVGSPSDAQIQTSLSNAVNIYWNLQGVTIFCDASDDDSIPTTSASAGSPGGTDTFPISNAGLPNTRAVGTGGDPLLVYDNELYALDTDADRAPQTSTSICTAKINTNIIRMYDGATSSESNFVGYGIGSAIGGAAASGESSASSPNIGINADVFIGSFLNGTPSDTTQRKTQLEYVTITQTSPPISIPIVCLADAQASHAATFDVRATDFYAEVDLNNKNARSEIADVRRYSY